MNKSALENLSRKKIYAIEGNIGAGKTTILKILSKVYDDILLVEEPVKEWQNLNGNLLDEFYKNPERWCYSFESYVLISKMNALIKAADSEKSIILLERSMFADKIFFDLAVKMKRCNELEEAMFNNVFNYLLSNVYPKLNGLIYLDTPVSECMNRIAIRNRNEENKIEEEYLSSLNAMFLDMVHTSNIPTLRIDGRYSLERDIEQIRKEVGSFIGLEETTGESCEIKY